MKSLNLYREQVEYMTNWFKAWTECEQTVALYTLLKRITGTQGKFLYNILEQTLKTHTDLDQIEKDANDSDYLESLAGNTMHTTLVTLLAHLPLLQLGNTSAKTIYWKLLPKVLDTDSYIIESKELLSYALIHPAISSNERLWLAQLQHEFLTKVALKYSQQSYSDANETVPNGQYRTNNEDQSPSPVPDRKDSGVYSMRESASETVSSRNESNNEESHAAEDSRSCKEEQDIVHPPLKASMSCSTQPQATSSSTPKRHQLLRRTVSVNPPGYQLSSAHTRLTSQDNVSSSLPTTNHSPPPPTSDHTILSPQNSATSSSSGSDSHTAVDSTQKNSFLERGSGMRDVPTWLRHLRLHKYAHLFQTLTYEDMLELTEEWLHLQNVTTGGTNKIMLNIKRLKSRQTTLKMLEEELTNGCSVTTVLDDMKSMLDMPLKHFTPSNAVTSSAHPANTTVNVESLDIEEGDVPGQFTRLLLKVTTQLLIGEPNPKSFQTCRQLITKCINHEAFTEKQIKTLESRKVALEACHSHMVRFRLYNRQGPTSQQRVTSATLPSKRMGSGQNYQGGSSSWPANQSADMNWSFGCKRAVLGGTTSSHTLLSRSHTNPLVASHANDGKQSLSRTQSAPLNSKGQTLSLANRPVSYELRGNESDYNAQLESLCISMTEHALSTSDNGDNENTSNNSPAARLSADQSAQWYC